MNRIGKLLVASMIVALGHLGSGCGSAPQSKGRGPVLKIVETYGEGDHSFTASAMIRKIPNTTRITLGQVNIKLHPESIHSPEKLESLLEDVELNQEDPKAWPETARALPQEALPLLRRFQLALLILNLPETPSAIDYATVNIFQENPSFAFTRVRQELNKVHVDVIALAGFSDTAVLAWSRTHGYRSSGTVLLSGSRQVGRGKVEKIGLDLSIQPSRTNTDIEE